MGCSVTFEEQCRVDVAASRNRLMTGANWFKGGFMVSLLKTGKRLFLAVMFIALSGAISAQTIYYWIGGTSGNFDNRNSWSLTVGGSAVGSNPGTNNSIVFVVDGTDISSAPGLQTGDVAINLPNPNMTNGGWRIVNNAKVSLVGNRNRQLTLTNQTGTELLVETGCVLDVSYMWGIILSNNSSSEINGELIINGNTYDWDNNSVTVTVNGTITNNGASISSLTSTLRFNPYSVYNHNRDGGIIPAAVWDATSTVNVNGIAYTTPTGFNQTFGNLNLNGTSIVWNRTVSLTGHTVVQGNFYIRGSSSRILTLSTSDFNFTVNGTTTIDYNGAISDTNINQLNRFDGLVTIAPNGSFNVSPGVSEFRGGITNNGTFTNNGLVTFSGSSSQILSGTSDFNIGYNATNSGISIIDGTSVELSSNLLFAGSALTINTSASTALNAIGGTFYFNGNTVQSMSGSSSGEVTFYYLDLSSNNVKTLNYPFYVAMDLTINPGTTLNMGTGSNTIEVDGDVMVQGTLDFNGSQPKVFTARGDFDAATGTVSMNGTGLAHELNLYGGYNEVGTFNTTAGSGSIVRYAGLGDQSVFASDNYVNLGISGGGEKLLSGNTTVSGTIDFLNGVLQLSDHNLTLTSGLANPVTGTLNSTSMIGTDGDGYLIRNAGVASGIHFALGSGGYYSPVVIDAISPTTGTISVRAVSGMLGSNFVEKYWDIKTGSDNPTATVTFSYSTPECGFILDTVYYMTPTGIWTGSNGTVSFGANSFTVSNTTDLLTTSTYWSAAGERNTYYSYQTGNWNSASTWTTDPSGSTLVGSQVPSVYDEVVILTDRTVYLTADVPTEGLLLTVESGGFLDMAGYMFTQPISKLQGEGTIKLASDHFPTVVVNTFVDAGGGTVQYCAPYSFTLPTYQTVYNNLVINTAGKVALQMTDITLNGNLEVVNGTYQINDASSTTPLTLTVNGDVHIHANGRMMVGTGPTNGTISSVTTGGTAPFTNYYNGFHTVVFYGDFTNEGFVRFTNLEKPLYNAFPPTTETSESGAASVYFLGSSNNTLTANGVTDFYNLILDKGTDRTYSLTVQSSSYDNFRLFGANILAAESTDPNANMRKALWIRTGSLVLDGLIVVPSLAEGNSANSNFIIPYNGALKINGADVLVNTTADDYREVNIAYSIDAASTGSTSNGAIGVNVGNYGALNVHGTLQVNNGYLSTKESAGIIASNITGQIIINGGTVDTKQLLFETGSAYYSQSGGLMILRGRLLRTPVDYTSRINLFDFSFSSIGTSRAENGINNGYASFDINNGTNIFIMSGGTVRIYDATTSGSAPAFNVNSASGNYNVTGGTLSLVPVTGSVLADASSLLVSSTSPLGGLRIERPSSSTNIQLGTPIEVLGNLTMVSGVLNSNNNNLAVGGNIFISNTSTYNPGTNTTTLNGASNQSFTIDCASALTLNNFSLDKSAGTAVTLAGSQNSLIVTGELNLISATLKDGGKTIRVAGNIYNSGVHSGTGKILLDGTSVQSISGGGAFGNIELFNTNTASAPVTLGGDITINGVLTLSNDKLFNIGTNQLTFGVAASIVNAGNSRYIMSSGNAGDGGVSKIYSSTGNIFYFPVGAPTLSPARVTKFTPVTIGFTSDPTTYGTVTVVPVGYEQPNVSISGQNLTYYWKIKSTGFMGINPGSVSHTFVYDQSDVVGTETNYVPSVFRASDLSWNTGSYGIDFGTNTITDWGESSNYLNGDYTAGVSSSFGTPEVYYSRRTGLWNNTTTWSLSGHTIDDVPATVPGAGDIVIIGGSDSVYLRTNNSTANTGAVQVATLMIEAGSALDNGYNPASNYSMVATHPNGNGNFRVAARYNSGSTFEFPEGDFTEFNVNTGTTELYSTNPTAGTTYFLPDDVDNYGNLILSPRGGSNVIFANLSLTIYGDLVTRGQNADSWFCPTWGINYGPSYGYEPIVPKTISIHGDMLIQGGALVWIGNGNVAQDFVVDGNVFVGTNSALFAYQGYASLGTGYTYSEALNQSLSIGGSLINNADGYRPSGVSTTSYTSFLDIPLTFFGPNPASITNTTGNTAPVSTTLENVVVNKGTSSATSLTIDIAGTLTTPANGWLTLQNGTLVYNRTNPSSDFTITTTSPFNIPETAGLTIDYTTSADRNVLIANANRNDNDLYLDGKLTVANGNLYIGPTGSPDYNNDIEYSGSSNSSIVVSGGNLVVNGQIRRPASTTNGALSYTQSGGNVTINGRNTLTTRAKLEVLNGGSFNMSGGNLTIVRGGGINYGDLYLRPASSNVTGGTIYLEHDFSGNPQTYGLESTVSLNNLVITGRTATTAANATVNLMTSPLVLKGSLTLTNANSIFNANNRNVTLGGNFVNNGTYAYGTNTTTFNGGSQTISGTTLTNFHNLTVSSSTSLTVNYSFSVGKNLTINSGTLVLNDYGVFVAGNVVNNGAYLDNNIAGSGLILNGTTQQQISGSGAFNRIELNNPAGARTLTDISLSSDIRLTKGVLDIGSRGLILNQTSQIIPGNPFGTFNMIKTDGVSSSSGIRKYFGASSQEFTFPVGVTGKYTPAIFDITQNTAAGYINIVPVEGCHPGVEDPSQALDYYWNIDNGGMSLEATVQFKYSQGDVMGTESNYLPSRLLYPLNIWYQYDAADIDETNNLINFSFTYPTTNINGAYTAGTDPAIDDRIPKYQSNQDGDWSNPDIWTTLNGSGPCPPGGPYGADVIVDHDVTVDVNNIFANSVTINDILRISPSTAGHNFTLLLGNGTLYVESGNIPGGDYSTFTDCAGNSTIEYGGNTDYTIVASLYDNIPNLIFSGTGTRYLPNKDITVCKRLVIDGPTVDNSINNKDLYIKGTMERYGTGEFVSGTGTVIFNGTGIQTIGGPLGDFSGSSSFYNFTVNNSSGLNIGTDGLVEISNVLNLTEGIINTSSTGRLFISNTSPAAVNPSGGKATSYINGPLTKRIMNGASFLYPIGDGKDRSVPFTITSAAGTSVTADFTAAYHVPNPVFSPYESTLYGVNSDEYWSVSSSIPTSLQLSIAYNNTSGLTPLMVGGNINSMTIAEYDPDIWSDLPTSVSGSTSSGVITMTGTTSSPTTPKNFTTASKSAILPKISLQPAGGGYTVCGLTEGIPIKFSPTSMDITPIVLIQYRINGGALIDIEILDTENLEYTIATAIPGIYELRTFTFNSGTPGVVDATPVTVYNYPSGVDAGPDYSGCGEYETTLAASPPKSGETGLWTIITGTGGQFTGVDGNKQYNAGFKGLSGQSYTLRWTVTNTVGGCSSSDDVVISFPVAPSQPGNFTSGPVNVCQGSTHIYAVPNVAGNTYNWSYSGTGVTFSGNTNSVTATFANNATSGTVSVTASNSCGTSAYARNLNVNVHALPTPNVIGPVSACPLTGGIVYQTTNNVGSSYSWTISGGSITAGAGTNSVTVTWGASGTGTIRVTETNSHGCVATSADLTVDIADTTPPVISNCPADITENNDSDACGAYVSWIEPTANDNCSGPLSFSSRSHTPGTTFFPIGTTLVTYTFTDASSNTSTCTFNVTVVDAQPPTVSASGNISVNTSYDGTGDCTAFIAIADATFSDNCGGATLSWSMSGATTASGTGQIGGYTFSRGVTTIIYTATDAALNTSTSSMTVTVVDDEDPTITAPADMLDVAADAGYCYATISDLGSALTDDNCSVASVENDAPATFPLGSTTVTWTVTDGSGNTATDTQLVTVVDTQAPTITAPADMLDVAADAGYCYATISDLGSALTDDNCSVASVENDAPATFPLGSTTVTWTVTDGSGNTATDTQLVTVVDTQAPTITAPADMLDVAADAGYCYATISDLGSALTDDNCSVASVENDAPATFPLGSTTVTWTVTDGSGNTATDTQLVTVVDTQAPTITAPADMLDVAADAGYCYATISDLGSALTDDNCSVASVENDAPATFPLGSTTVTWTVTDASGNTATDTQLVTVVDTQAPTITAPADMLDVAADAGYCYATISDLGSALTDDNCSVASVENDAPATFPLGSTTVTWTVTDGSGNTATDTQLVTVVDTQAPTITAPADMLDVAADAGYCYATISDLGSALTDDNCSVASVENDAPATFPLGSTTVTWTVTDGSGNTATDTQLVTVVDTQAPTITAPADMLDVAADAGYCYATISDLGSALTDDNCSVASVENDAPATFPLGSTTVTWTVTDGSGNTATDTQLVTVVDTQAPTITAPADMLDVAADAGYCYATISDLGSALTDDNCSVASVENDAPATFPLGSTTVTWTVTDGSGNTATDTQLVTVVDTQAPTITAPADMLDVAADAGYCYATISDLGSALTDDNCSVASVENDAPATFPLGSTTVTWTVTDGSGNTATDTQLVTVVDTQAPTITAPADMLDVAADAGYCYATISDLGSALTDDNCSVASVENDAPATFPLGSTTVTWTVTDGSGNTATDTQLVTVVDTQAPTITAPADMLDVAADAGYCYATISDLGSALTDDNCSVASVENDAPATFPLGSTTVTWTVTDGSGNTATDTQLVTVVDTQAPTITAPADMLDVAADAGYCYATISDLGSALTDDNCSVASVENDAPATFPLGSTTVTWTVTDASGNTATDTQLVTVVDTQAPTITAPADMLDVAADAGYCYATISDLGSALTDDNCSVASVENDAPATFPLGSTTVTWTVTDASGNTATDTQLVTVVDTQAPTITAPADMLDVAADAGYCYATISDLGSALTDDNCSVASVENDAPATFPLGSTTVTWTVTDGSGNTATDTQLVTVVDTQAPTITAPADMLDVAADAGYCYATISDLGSALTDDNCSVASVENDAPATFPLGSTTVTWTVTDGSGNTATDTQLVTVVDTQAPTITAPADMLDVAADAGYCYATISDLGSALTDDNCSVASVENDAPATFPLGSTTVTWTVTDGSGNTATDTQLVTVVDTQAPTITAPADMLDVAADAGYCYATISDLGSALTDDNCSVASVENDAPATFPLGSTTVTWTVTDASGNTATDTQLVTVVDTQAPTITAPADMLDVAADAGYCYATISDLGSALTDDNCSVASVENDAPATFPLGSTTVTWTVTDGSGNTATDTQLVTVVDTQAPTITAPADMLDVAADAGYCYATISDLGSALTDDNCSVASVENDAPATFPLGSTTVTWTVTDGSGNTATDTQLVTVVDTQAPTITAPADMLDVAADAGYCYATISDLGSALTDDNCSVASVENDAPATFPLGSTTVTWTVTDGSGNTATDTQLVTVVDTQAPTITAPADMLDVAADAGYCYATISDLGSALTDDNCSVASVENDAPATFPLGSTTVTWTVTDGSGNTATDTQLVTVVDTQAPIVSNCPSNITVNNDSGANSAVVTWVEPTANDNCSGLLTYDTRSHAPGSTFPVGSTEVTYTFTDASSNTTTCTFTVTVVDNEPPVLTCPGTITVQCIGEVPAAYATLIDFTAAGGSATDNVGVIATSFTLIDQYSDGGVCPETITRVYAIGDNAGNVSNCTQSIVIDDTTPPALTGTIPDGATGMVLYFADIPTGPTEAEIAAQYTDNCSGAVTATKSGTPTGNDDSWTVTYTYLVQDACGNSVVPSPTVTYSGGVTGLGINIDAINNVLCFGEATGSVMITVSGGITPYSYSWKNSLSVEVSTSQDLVNVVADNYTITVTDKEGKIATQTVSITQPASSVNFTTSVVQACYGESTGSITVNGVGGTSPYTYSIQGGAYTATNVFTGLAAGTYLISVKDDNGCTVSDYVSVTQPMYKVAGTTQINENILCYGERTGSVTINATGGTGVYTYSIDGGSTYVANNTFTGLRADSTYTAFVRDSNGCLSNPITVLLSQPTKVVATLKPYSEIQCNGGYTNVEITVSGGYQPYSYKLDGGAPSNIGIFTVAAGTHTVVVRDYYFCTDTITFTVGQPTALTLSIVSQTNIVCSGETGSVTVQATGGVGSYQYKIDGGTYSDVSVFSGLAAGSHQVTVMDANNCLQSIPVNITTIPFLTGNIIGSPINVSCNGGDNGSITVRGSDGTPPYRYRATTDGTGAYSSEVAAGDDYIISGLSAGIYTVSIRDANNCLFTFPSTIEITEPDALVVTSAAVTTPIFCSGGTGTVTIVASGGTSPYSYTFNGETNDTGVFTGVLAGLSRDYSVTDANLCGPVTGSIDVAEPEVLAVTSAAVTTPIVCNGGTGTVTIVATGGTAPYSYTFNGETNSTGIFTGVLAGLSQGYSVTDANLCGPVTGSIDVAEPEVLAVTSATVTTPIVCNGGTGTVTIVATGGTAPYSYTFNGETNSTGIFTGVLAGLSQGYSVTDANLCGPVTGSIDVAEPEVLAVTSATVTTPIVCNGGTGTVTIVATGGTAPYSYTFNGETNSTGIFTGVLAGLSQGYSVTDANLCGPVTGSIDVAEPEVLAVTSATVTTPIVCNGGTGTVTIVATGGTAPYSYTFNGETNSTGVFTGVLAGLSRDYSVTDANGCGPVTGSIDVAEPEVLAVTSATVTTPIACNGGTGTVTIVASGGTAPYSYTFNGETNATGIFTGVSAGPSQGYSVTDANLCGPVIGTIDVVEPGVISVVLATVTTPIVCNGGTGTVTIVATGGTAPYSYTFNGETNDTGIFTGVSAGLSRGYSVTDQNGCGPVTGSIDVAEPEVLAVTSAAVTTPISCNGGTGTVTIVATGGTAPYSYTFNGETNDTGIFTGVSTGPSQGYSVTDANLCGPVTGSIDVAEPEVLAVTSATVTTPIVCNGGTGTVTIVATGGTAPYSYTFNGETNDTGIFTGVSAGPSQGYSVTDQNGCGPVTGSIDVAEPEVLAVTSATVTTPIVCNGGTGTVTIVATGGTAPYSYTFNGETNDTGIFTGVSAGPSQGYSVTDQNGCGPVTGSIDVAEPDVISVVSAEVTTPIACNGGTGTVTIVATGGTAPYSYTFNGETNDTGIFTGVSAGPSQGYSVTDQNGCGPVTGSIDVAEPDVISVVSAEVTTPIACNGGTGTVTIVATGGTAPYVYLFNGDTTDTGVFTNVSAGSSQIYSITDANGCDTVIGTIDVVEPDAISVVSAAVTTPIACNGGTGTVTIVATGGTAPYSYVFNGDTTDTGVFTGVLAGSSQPYSVTDANGCGSITGTIDVAEPDPISITINKVDVAVYGESTGSATAVVSGGTGAYSYEWDTDPVETTDAITGLAAGTYTVTVTDANGCIKSESITIDQPAPPLSLIIIDQINVLCYGDYSGSVTVEGVGGVPPYEYSIDGGAYQSSGLFTGLAEGDYTVEVRDDEGTTASILVSITQPASPLTLSTSQENVLCYGASTGTATVVALGGTGAYSYLWDTQDARTTATITGLSAGTYNVTVTDENGCMATTSVTITQPDQIVATFTTTDLSCNGGSDGTAKVSVTGGTGTYAYLWSTGETTDSIGGLVAGTYTLTIFDGNCSVDVECEITEPDAILITPFTTDTRCPDSNDGSITLNISGGTEPFLIYWSDGITTKDRTNIQAGTYSVVVTDSNGCASSAEVEVRAGMSPDCIEYPTIFTPNNDGHNDKWIIKNIENYPDAELEIFNRWGRRVYRTRNISAEPWDGYYNGRLLPTDSYHYVLNLRDGSAIKTGVITLIR